ncbi:MAG: hypothetical protein AAF721_16175, partial [Myxococcota bacterium]
PSVATALAQIDPSADSALDDAAAAFLAHYAGAEAVDEAQRKIDLDALAARVAEGAEAVDAAVAKNFDYGSAACEATGKCSSDPPSAEATAWVAAQHARGIVFRYAGEGTTEAKLDPSVLAKRLAKGLSPAAAGYLLAQAADDKALANYDEDGYGGPADDLVDAIVAWEAVDRLGASPYRATAESRASALLSEYLRMGYSEFNERRHPVTEEHRASYARFIRDHADSRYAAAVERFVAAVGKHGFKPTEAQLDQAVRTATQTK